MDFFVFSGFGLREKTKYFGLIFPLLGGRILPSQRYLISETEEDCGCGAELKTVIIKVIRTNAGTFVTTIY